MGEGGTKNWMKRNVSFRIVPFSRIFLIALKAGLAWQLRRLQRSRVEREHGGSFTDPGIEYSDGMEVLLILMLLK